jgi:hypothetical protein
VYIYLTSSIVAAMNSSDDRRRQVDVHQAWVLEDKGKTIVYHCGIQHMRMRLIEPQTMSKSSSDASDALLNKKNAETASLCKIVLVLASHQPLLLQISDPFQQLIFSESLRNLGSSFQYLPTRIFH